MGGITIYRFVTLCAAAGALIVAAPGRAQTYIDQCNEQGKRFSIEARIDGCTATIKSGKSSGKDLAAAYGNRGHAYTDKKDYDRAIADFNEAIKLAPKFASAFTNRCFTRMLVGRELSQALADCNESLRLQPNDGNTLGNRGCVQFKLGAFDRSKADFSAAIAQDPKDAESLYGRGMAKLKSGDAAGGNADIAAAKAIKSDVADEMAGFGIK